MTTTELDTITLALCGEEGSDTSALTPGFLLSYNVAYTRLVRERARPVGTADATLDGGVLDFTTVAGADQLVAVRNASGAALPSARLGGGRYAVAGTAPGATVTVEYVQRAPQLVHDETPPAGTENAPSLLPDEGSQMALCHWAAYVYLSGERRYNAAGAQLELYRQAAEAIPRGAAVGLARLNHVYERGL